MSKTERLYQPDDIELELETTKWYCADAAITSVNNRSPDWLTRDKAVELLEIWFGPDDVVVAAVYKATHKMI